MLKKRVLLGSPVHQNPAILKEFLLSLEELEQLSATLDFMFLDDNTDSTASQLLCAFQDKHPETTIIPNQHLQNYTCDEYTHYWREELIWKVAGLKNKLIEQAKTKNYDYLWLVDSDLVMHPHTLEQLMQADKDIIANIFWTCWQPNTVEMPQVWLEDQYTLYWKKPGEVLTDEEANRRLLAWLSQLRVPGIYEVGGLGACTLISLQALKAGVSFAELKNLSFWGEDRHFCIRAAALGFSLYVDTHYPAYHIYRESDLNGVASYQAKWQAAQLD